MAVLRVAKRITCTESEGPGRRYALWVQGCSIRCEGCCNPEMFAARGGEELTIDELADEVASARVTSDIEGLTVLGGEPFEQAEGVAALARKVRELGLSVMVFTGFVREQLTEPDALALVDAADVLADGPFMKERPGSRWRWLGSENQRMHFLTGRYSADDPRFSGQNTIDVRIVDGRIEVSGWAPAVMTLGLDRLRKRSP